MLVMFAFYFEPQYYTKIMVTIKHTTFKNPDVDGTSCILLGDL